MAGEGAGVVANRRALRLKLRLDDGSLVAHASLLGQDPSQGVIRLPVETCLKLNLAGEAELQRIQRLLASPDLPELSLGPGPSKKAKMLDRQASLSAPAENWVPKCHDLWQKAIDFLGTDSHWFMNKVDPSVAPNYYDIVKKPMWLNRVKEKLIAQQYTTPNEFWDDLRQIWANCKLYNPVGNPVRNAAENAERKLEERWAMLGLSSERSKRLTAGQAPAKYDPEVDLLPKARPSASRGGQPSAPKANKRAQNGGRTTSQEVVSGGGRARMERPLSAERRQGIANALQQSLVDGSLDEHKTSELMGLLPQSALSVDDAGETELDFEALDDATLRQLENWLNTNLGRAQHGSPSHLSQNPSVRLDAASDDDEDYMSD